VSARLPRRGEIWRVLTPNQPYDPHTPRPALIISENRRNWASDDYLVVPAFSEGNLGPTRVFLPAGQGGIDHDSILFCDEIVCLDMDLVSLEDGPQGGVVDDEIVEAVVIAVRRAIGDVVPLRADERGAGPTT
jgi:mRNA-degrading endonuclease toxin of MazEF toxin-antitoxin module